MEWLVPDLVTTRASEAFSSTGSSSHLPVGVRRLPTSESNGPASEPHEVGYVFDLGMDCLGDKKYSHEQMPRDNRR